jgi:hypothetical protein
MRLYLLKRYSYFQVFFGQSFLSLNVVFRTSPKSLWKGHDPCVMSMGRADRALCTGTVRHKKTLLFDNARRSPARFSTFTRSSRVGNFIIVMLLID